MVTNTQIGFKYFLTQNFLLFPWFQTFHTCSTLRWVLSGRLFLQDVFCRRSFRTLSHDVIAHKYLQTDSNAIFSIHGKYRTKNDYIYRQKNVCLLKKKNEDLRIKTRNSQKSHFAENLEKVPTEYHNTKMTYTWFVMYICSIGHDSGIYK